VYGDHLGFFVHDDFKYDTNTTAYTPWALDKLKECQLRFADWTV